MVWWYGDTLRAHMLRFLTTGEQMPITNQSPKYSVCARGSIRETLCFSFFTSAEAVGSLACF
jgi:hypothetical protein